jgi:predicted HicB family RNase H-like nuclease
MNEIIEVMAAQIVPAIAAVLVTFISVGLVHLNRWLKMKTGSEAIAVAGKIVETTVNELTATTVKDLKIAAEDGKLTLEEAHKVKDEALVRVKAQLPPAVAKAAGLAISDLNTFISGTIEQKVIEAKK